MKTKIQINGGIGSIYRLYSALIHNEFEVEIRNLMFNGKQLTFNTRKEAYKALSIANKTLKMDNLDTWYSPKYSLKYDAATAQIEKHL